MAIVDPRTGAPLTTDTTGTQGSAAGAAQGGAASADVIVDVDLQNFQQVVLEGSMKGAVLLLSWSTQADSSALVTTLEKLAREYHGGFLLAKLDAGANPQVAAQLGIRSIPDVKLIVQGQLYDQFQGDLPESQIRQWLSQHIQAPADAGVPLDQQAAQALEAGETQQARELYTQLIEAEPTNAEHRVGLAEVFAAEGDTAQAQEILDSLSADQQGSPRAKALKARLGFAGEAPSHEEIAALGDQDDSEARFKRAFRQIADGRYEEGLEGLLAIMKTDRAYGDDAARKTLLKVFEALGNDHPLTIDYRRKMFALLY
ncbi:tetratricopeptide repeat protein [Carnimonas bestiolae]|uniref:tetratricopeptide repeat protein n=1 Tax=Carnimonas bestiolae TaxID=3402172 RepID=UPI003EDCA208